MPSINGFDLIIDEKNLRFISIFVIYLHLEQLSLGDQVNHESDCEVKQERGQSSSMNCSSLIVIHGLFVRSGGVISRPTFYFIDILSPFVLKEFTQEREETITEETYGIIP